MSKKISVGFVNTQKTAGRSSKIPVVLRLQNRSKLPVANMIIEIEYYNTLDGDKNTMKINTPFTLMMFSILLCTFLQNIMAQ